jgi:hypothetical protein
MIQGATRILICWLATGVASDHAKIRRHHRRYNLLFHFRVRVGPDAGIGGCD